MDKASVTDAPRRVAGDAAAALALQPTYQSDKRARQKAARAVATESRAGAATLIAALWREAAVRNAAAATRKVKARRAEVELAVVVLRAEQEQAATNEVAHAVVQAGAHARAQAEENTQIWVRAIGSHDSRSVMVSLKAPTGDTKLAGLGNCRLYSPQVGTLEPEKSFAAQGIAKGATLSLLPRLLTGGMEGTPKGKGVSLAQSPESPEAAGSCPPPDGVAEEASIFLVDGIWYAHDNGQVLLAWTTPDGTVQEAVYSENQKKKHKKGKPGWQEALEVIVRKWASELTVQQPSKLRSLSNGYVSKTPQEPRPDQQLDRACQAINLNYFVHSHRGSGWNLRSKEAYYDYEPLPEGDEEPATLWDCMEERRRAKSMRKVVGTMNDKAHGRLRLGDNNGLAVMQAGLDQGVETTLEEDDAVFDRTYPRQMGGELTREELRQQRRKMVIPTPSHNLTIFFLPGESSKALASRAVKEAEHAELELDPSVLERQIEEARKVRSSVKGNIRHVAIEVLQNDAEMLGKVAGLDLEQRRDIVRKVALTPFGTAHCTFAREALIATARHAALDPHATQGLDHTARTFPVLAFPIQGPSGRVSLGVLTPERMTALGLRSGRLPNSFHRDLEALPNTIDIDKASWRAGWQAAGAEKQEKYLRPAFETAPKTFEAAFAAAREGGHSMYTRVAVVVQLKRTAGSSSDAEQSPIRQGPILELDVGSEQAADPSAYKLCSHLFNNATYSDLATLQACDPATLQSGQVALLVLLTHDHKATTREELHDAELVHNLQLNCSRSLNVKHEVHRAKAMRASHSKAAAAEVEASSSGRQPAVCVESDSEGDYESDTDCWPSDTPGSQQEIESANVHTAECTLAELRTLYGGLTSIDAGNYGRERGHQSAARRGLARASHILATQVHVRQEIADASAPREGGGQEEAGGEEPASISSIE